MKKNKDVIVAWSKGKAAEAGHISTDGKDLFSYRLKIGYTTKDNKKIVILHCGPQNSWSVTTSRHVNEARNFADREVEP